MKLIPDVSFPRKRESSQGSLQIWIPIFMGMTFSGETLQTLQHFVKMIPTVTLNNKFFLMLVTLINYKRNGEECS